MINFLRIFFSLLILVLLTPQTTEVNKVLKIFHESGLFMNYKEARDVLRFLTWFVIFLFFFFSLL